MRILHLVNELVDNGNGIVNVAVDLSCTQSDDGHEVVIASRGGEFVPLVVDHDVTHRQLPMSTSVRGAVQTRRQLRELIARFDPDIVHSHTLTPAAVAFWVRTEDWLFRRRPRYRLVTTVHNEYQRGAILMGCSDAVVSVSRAVDALMARRRIPERRRRVVINGVIGTPRRRRPKDVAAADVPEEAIVVVGAVSRRKGVDVIAEAFAAIADAHPRASLWFVGNPDWAEFVRAVSSGPLRDRIHFVGMKREPAAYLNAATMMVLASRREPMGLVLVEAREVGVPIIASDVDGIPEALDGGDAGRLVPAEDSAALAEAMSEFLDSPDVRTEYRARARNGVERFTTRRMADDYADIYLDEIGRATS